MNFKINFFCALLYVSTFYYSQMKADAKNNEPTIIILGQSSNMGNANVHQTSKSSSSGLASFFKFREKKDKKDDVNVVYLGADQDSTNPKRSIINQGPELDQSALLNEGSLLNQIPFINQNSVFLPQMDYFANTNFHIQQAIAPFNFVPTMIGGYNGLAGYDFLDYLRWNGW